MNLKEYIQKEIRNVLLETVNEDRVNDFFYIELKKKMYNRRKDYSDKIKKLGSLEKLQYLEDLYVKVNGIEGKSSARDIKGNGIDLYKRLVKDKIIREDYELDQAFHKAKPVDEKSEEEKADYVKGYEPVEEKAERDYKKEYEKYGKSKKAKKYRAELNKYNRQKGTYGNGDGKDASHKGGKIVGFEDESKNRGRREKSRLKKESVAPNHDGNSAPYGSGYDKIEELKGVYEGTRCWKGYERKGFKKHPFSGKRVPNCVKAESIQEIKEGVMKDIHMMIKSAATEDEFVKRFFKKYGKDVKKSMDSVAWVKDLYNEDVSSDSLKDIPTKKDESYKVAGKRVTLIKGKKSDGTDWKVKFQNGKEVSLSDVLSLIKPFPKGIKESVNEEQLDEKLITFSNRAPYGQAVFMAGGAGSGKGFAISNFIDSAGFKVRDVDEMKKQLASLEKLGKLSIDKWYKKYGKNLSDKPLKKGQTSPKAHVEEFVLGSGKTISQIASDLKNPNNVASLHYIVDSMGLKDKWLISMLSGKNNPETLPNLLFDITAKKVSSITQIIKPLAAAGYNPKNIHLIWVLKRYVAAVKANKTRDRVVPEDILLTTHEGASETIWHIITKALPKGLDGRIDVILNNNEHTAFFVDDKGEKIKVEPNQQNKLDKAAPVVKGFVSLPVKKQGGGILPEKRWQMELVRWILGNAPASIDLDNPSQFKKKDEEYMI